MDNFINNKLTISGQSVQNTHPKKYVFKNVYKQEDHSVIFQLYPSCVELLICVYLWR